MESEKEEEEDWRGFDNFLNGSGVWCRPRLTTRTRMMIREKEE